MSSRAINIILVREKKLGFKVMNFLKIEYFAVDSHSYIWL